MDVDFLLVGQGIAGTALAHRLTVAGKKVAVIDQAKKNNSSRVAAGLFNPITGRQMVKTWMADQLFPEIEHFYTELEEFVGAEFFHTKPIYRPFASIEEQNEWMGKSGDSEYLAYLHRVKQSSLYAALNDPHGGLLLRQSGYVNLNSLLDAYASLLQRQGLFRDEAFDENDLSLDDGKIVYRDITAGHLVFTNGLGALHSRFFNWLPLKPNKGEILLIKQDFCPEEIINRGIFRISLPDNSARVGSTYSNSELSPGPTAAAR